MPGTVNPSRYVVLLLLILLAHPAQAFWGALSKIGKLADDAADVGKVAGGADDAARAAVPTEPHARVPVKRNAEDATAEETGLTPLGAANLISDIGQLAEVGHEDDPAAAPKSRSKPKPVGTEPSDVAKWVGWSFAVIVLLGLFLLPFWLLWRLWRWLTRCWAWVVTAYRR